MEAELPVHLGEQLWRHRNDQLRPKFAATPGLTSPVTNDLGPIEKAHIVRRAVDDHGDPLRKT